MGTGKEPRRAEPLLDLRGGREVALGLLVALQGGARVPRAQSINPHTEAPVIASWLENGSNSS